ncbi:hypothetical protein CXB51_004094 [Gossypium anomalum]|uniref:Amino acid transporter transmembrane domain-containing protein n=1 Tax=Gossypium anomalum TaxID=47600 RepID=A0A8J5ZM62_9ROSI|nr:hypothetical protein CXB51_004094 [Gossypium anomalum]
MTTADPNFIHLSSPQKENGVSESPGQLDAGALFVLKSRGHFYFITLNFDSHAHLIHHVLVVGSWLHSGFPFALSLLGWAPGLLITTLQAFITFYSYNLLSVILDHHAQLGKRQLRFRDMARDILVHLLALQSNWENAAVPVYNYLWNRTTILGTDTILSFAKTYQPCFSTPCSCIQRMRRCWFDTHRNAPNKDYSIKGSKENRILGAINGISIIATTYGCGIIPEIQATIAPPVKGKMFKGLCVCFGVIVSTYFSVAISGYWAFGNQSQPSILSNFMDENRPLLPLGFYCSPTSSLMQLVTITVMVKNLPPMNHAPPSMMSQFNEEEEIMSQIYLQPTNEVFEKWFANPKLDQFSARNVMPRLVLRSLSVIIGTTFAAMFPFFGDIMALFGAFGVIPLDFILPMVLYNLTFKPSRQSIVFWANTLIAVASSALVAMGALASVRQIILDAKTYNLFANV